MRDPDTPPPALPPEVAALLRIAADLRELPDDAFKTRLRSALLFPEAPGPGEGTAVAHDVGAAFAALSEMSMRFLASVDRWTLGVSRFSTPSHWERHPDGDELLHVVEGDIEITTLTDAGPVRATAGAGSIWVCPQGLWHRIRPRSPVSLLFVTPGKGTEHSDANDPPQRTPHAREDRPTFVAHDVGAALRALPELAITRDTTAAEADAAVRRLTTFEGRTVGVMRWSGLTPWERHPGGDELLHVLEGEVDVEVLTEHGPQHTTVTAGSVFVCPRGLWHRQLPRPGVTELFATPVSGEASWADDPRL